MKRMIAFLMVVIMISSLSACADTTVKGTVLRESAYGNAELDIMPQKLMEKVDIGDTVVVTIGDFEKEMPFIEEIIEEDGKLQLFLDREDWSISVCIFNGNFCETYGIDAGEKVLIEKK